MRERVWASPIPVVLFSGGSKIRIAAQDLKRGIGHKKTISQ
jgi:hypothetical protein